MANPEKADGYELALAQSHLANHPMARGLGYFETHLACGCRNPNRQPNINLAELNPCPLALPLLREQQEIVRRVEGLFALADQLEARLAKARERVNQHTPSQLHGVVAALVSMLVALTLVAQPTMAASVQRGADSIAYPDGRPAARYRLAARDTGPVLRHGSGPGQCDDLGARDVWVWEHRGSYFMHYDGAGTNGWLVCLATSQDLTNWIKKGPVLNLGSSGTEDSASASYGVTFAEGKDWHLFYLGTPHTSSAPDYVPAFPYLTLKARSSSPAGPWVKQPDVIPFRPRPGTYYSATASPGQIVPQGGEYLMFFSASTSEPTWRTLSIARTGDLDGAWRIDPEPIVPATEQVENTSLYYEPKNRTWWLFTNHVGLRDGLEYTDAVWVYWTSDLNHWNPAHKAVVLDSRNCVWSRHILGLPSVVKAGPRLAIFYDGHASEKMPAGVKSHMNRDVGLAWLDLPLVSPSSE